MDPIQIHLNDIWRILFGEVPVGFIIEAIVRLFVIYLILLISMRMLGQRMGSQLSRVELAGMVSLAAAIGVPVLAPDRGIIPAVIIAVIVVLIGDIVAKWTFSNRKVEKLFHGNIDVLVEDGVMNIDAMRRSRITHERLMAQLRSNGIRNLGEVQRLYLEASGIFSLLKREEPKPGLVTFPDWHEQLIGRMEHVKGLKACKDCGNVVETDNVCSNCQSTEWTVAVK
jgi:uncharacterized membrane protein YcaP (DUF421 family)